MKEKKPKMGIHRGEYVNARGNKGKTANYVKLVPPATDHNFHKSAQITAKPVAIDGVT